MPYSVTQKEILTVSAEAAVLCVENSMLVTVEPVSKQLAAGGGEALQETLRCQKFIPVGSASAMDPCGLPFRQLILTPAPHWLNGKSNELLILHRCYKSIFALAERLGLHSLATPFLSSSYYQFPLEDAVRIAFEEAEKSPVETLFVAGTPELYDRSRKSYQKPKIVSYIGYYRDHAIFELDNGLFARVDLRPEITEVMVIPYFEACYRAGNNPLQPALPEAELARLRQIYEEHSW